MTAAELAQRVLVGIAAAAAIVWFAVSSADMDTLASARRAGEVLQGRAPGALREAALKRGVADTRRAEDLRPGDHAPLSVRLYLYLFAGRTRSALAAAEQLIRTEPENRIGWMALAVLDPRRAAQARARLRALSPDPRRRG